MDTRAKLWAMFFASLASMYSHPGYRKYVGTDQYLIKDAASQADKMMLEFDLRWRDKEAHSIT